MAAIDYGSVTAALRKLNEELRRLDKEHSERTAPMRRERDRLSLVLARRKQMETNVTIQSE